GSTGQEYRARKCPISLCHYRPPLHKSLRYSKVLKTSARTTVRDYEDTSVRLRRVTMCSGLPAMITASCGSVPIMMHKIADASLMLQGPLTSDSGISFERNGPFPLR